MKKIIKFAKPNCSACDMVEQRLNALGIEHTNLSTDSQEYYGVLDYCKSFGLIVRQLPVVALMDGEKIERIWSGVFDINELQELL